MSPKSTDYFIQMGRKIGQCILTLSVNKRDKQVNGSVVFRQKKRKISQWVCRCPLIDEINRLMRLSFSVNRRDKQVNVLVDVRQQTRKIGQCVCRWHAIGEKYRSMGLSFYVNRQEKSVNGSVFVYFQTQSLQYNNLVSIRNPLQDTSIKPYVSMNKLYSISNYLLA